MSASKFPHGIYVVGAGVIGLMTAWELARAGVQTVLIERQAVGREASWAAGGILSPLYPWRYPDAVNALAQWSQTQYPALAAEIGVASGVDVEWFRCGMQIDGVADMDVALEWMGRNGMHVAHDKLKSSLWLPDIAQIRSPRLLQALRAAVIAEGGTVLENQSVLHVTVKDGRACGLQTDADFIPTDCCVIAAGAWTNSLIASNGLGLPVQPVRGQMLLYRTQPRALEHIILSDSYYAIPRLDGRVLVGSTLEHVGFNRVVTNEGRAALHAKAVELMPALANAPIERHWAGLRPSSPEGVPYVGEHPAVKGLWVSTGHYRNGVVMAPASARLVVDLILGRPPIVDPAPYRLSRG